MELLCLGDRAMAFQKAHFSENKQSDIQMLSSKTTKMAFGFDLEEEDGEKFYTFMTNAVLY